MLVISRKLGEKIYISENICVTVIDIDRGKIRLGIEAPRNVPVFRQELLPAGWRPDQGLPEAPPLREPAPREQEPGLRPPPQAPVTVTLADADRAAAVLRAQAQLRETPREGGADA